MASFRLLTAQQLSELPPTEHLCKTRFVARGLTVVFGPSGTYKSFYALDAALHIAQAHPVVYIAAEGSAGLNNRVSAWSSYHSLPADNLHFICEEVNLREESTVNALMRTIAPVKPALVIFDTLARCLVGGDENSARDVGMAVYNCARVQRAFDAAVAIVHHSNRADRGERGSGALRGAADAMIEISTSGDGLIQATCSKVKDSEPWESYSMVFKGTDNSGLLITATEAIMISLHLTQAEKSVIEFIGMSIFDRGAQVQTIINSLNISERHIYRVLSGLKNKGLVSRGKVGFPVTLTDMGYEILLTFADKNLPIAQPIAESGVDVEN